MDKKVISGVQAERNLSGLKKKEKKDTMEDADSNVYGKPLREPILGKYFCLPGRGAVEQRITLDTSQTYWPVYAHLKIHEAGEMKIPPPPPVIERIANEDYMEYYTPPKADEDEGAAGGTPVEGVCAVHTAPAVLSKTSIHNAPMDANLYRLSEFDLKLPERRKKRK